MAANHPDGGRPFLDSEHQNAQLNVGTELASASVPADSGSQDQQQSQEWGHHQGWPWLIAFFISSLTGALAVLWLSRNPALPNCQSEALIQASAAQLYCLEQEVRQGNLGALVSALEEVSEWPQADPLASQADHLANEWSGTVLMIARQKMEAGNLERAVKLAERIPESSSVHPEAQAAVQSWQKDWQRGKQGFKTAQDALKEQNWDKASDQLKLLAQIDSAYWRDQVEALIVQIAAEKQAWQKLQQAKDLAASKYPADLAAAINKANQVDTDSYVKPKAEDSIKQWSQTLLEIAQANLQDRNWQAAIAAAEKIPADSAAYAKAKDLVQLGQAETLAQKNQLGTYLHAWALAAQIQPQRSLHEQARREMAEWETQIQNMGQLKLATTIASLDQIFSYRLAIEQAQMVQPDQPRRIEAQTLIADWRNQIERFEDRHFLARARQLAAEGTLEQLKAAIAQASKIALGRALRLDAQTLIAQWQGQIQTIQDQPILNRARRLADQGQLEAAIQAADQISPGRALYSEAQTAISRWLARIQTTEDRPLLAEAAALANQGRLTEAIALAAEIRSGRALYYEAQDNIDRWIAERSAIEAARSTPEPEPPENQFEDQPAPLDFSQPLDEPSSDDFGDPLSVPEPSPAEPPTQREIPTDLLPRNQRPPRSNSTD